MLDSRFEDVLRLALRAEVAGLPMTITAESLERLAAERRARSRTRSRWLLLAAAAALLIAGIAAIVGSRLNEVVPPPTPTVTLPTSAELLADFEDATLRLEGSVGPADAPLDPAASVRPGASPAPVELGRVKLTGPFVIVVACLGPGDIVVQIQAPIFDAPYSQAVAPCDGQPVASEYLTSPIDPSSEGDVVSVVVDPGASWRVAFGEYPADVATPPSFEPIEVPATWQLVSDGGTVLLSGETPHTGARVSMPDTASRAAVFVQCVGDEPIAVSIRDDAPEPIPCGPAGDTYRIEVPVVGGELLTLGAVAGGSSRTWVRIVVFTDAEIATTYPSAPPLPPDVAAVPYRAPDNNVLAFGTIGSNRQTMLPIQGTRPGMPAGDLLPVSVFDETDGPHVHLTLFSISRGEALRDLATVNAPSNIFDSWADVTHDAIFYGVVHATGFEFHRIRTDGSDDRVVATVAPDPAVVSADLAVDDSVFVVESCHPGGACVRTVVDAATGESERTERAGDPICKIFGVVDGTIVGSTRPDCTEDIPSDIVLVPIDGGSPTVLLEDVPRSSREGAFVVDTEDGPRFVLGGVAGPDEMPWDVLDLTTGETSLLPSDLPSEVPRAPLELRLPNGWILLAGGSLGDFPWQRSFDRPVPHLVNLVTGETIELVNLPHWEGTFPE